MSLRCANARIVVCVFPNASFQSAAQIGRLGLCSTARNCSAPRTTLFWGHPGITIISTVMTDQLLLGMPGSSSYYHNVRTIPSARGSLRHMLTCIKLTGGCYTKLAVPACEVWGPGVLQSDMHLVQQQPAQDVVKQVCLSYLRLKLLSALTASTPGVDH
jgi:hypothetical protein